MEHAPPAGFQLPAALRLHVGEIIPDAWPRTAARGDARCHVFQCADILEVWRDTIGHARRVAPAFVTVLAADGKPALLLPLCIEERGGVRTLRFMDGGVSDCNAPIVYPPASSWGADQARAIVDLFRRSLPPFDLIALEKMPERVEDFANPLATLPSSLHPESCHVVALDGSWEEFARTRVPNAADSRRRRRKLEKLGDVRFEVAADDGHRSKILDAMMRMKRHKFVETKGYDVFTDPGVGDYYVEATRRLGAAGPVHLSALLLGDRVLAAHWGYVTADRFCHLMPAHEAGEWRQYAPGRLLNEWLIEWAFQRGLQFFDFGIGDEPYKFDYCDLHVPLRDVVLPTTAKGRLHAASEKMKLSAKLLLRESRIAPALIAARNYWRSLRKSARP